MKTEIYWVEFYHRPYIGLPIEKFDTIVASSKKDADIWVKRIKRHFMGVRDIRIVKG